MTRSLKSALVAGGTWVLAGKVVTVLTNLATQALLARLLTQQQYGNYVLAFSVATVGGMLAQFGLQHAAVRLIAQAVGAGRPGSARSVVRGVYVGAAVGSVAVTAALMLGPGAWLSQSIWQAPELAALLGALSLWVVASAFQVLGSEIFRGFKDLRLATIFGGVITGTAISGYLCVLWVAGRPTGLREVVLISAGSTALSALAALAVLTRRIARPGAGEPLPAAGMVRIALPLWINGLSAYVLVHAAVWILAAVRSKEEVAIYGAAARLVNLVSTPLLLINLIVPPYIADLYARGEIVRLQRVLRGTATLAGVPAFLVLLTFLLFGGPIMTLVFSESYRSGAVLLAVISFGALGNVWTGSCGVTMGMTGHQNALMAITATAAAIGVGGALLFAPSYGNLGVAVVVCAATLFQNAAQWLATRRLTGLWTHVGIPDPALIRSLLGRQ